MRFPIRTSFEVAQIVEKPDAETARAISTKDFLE
jgi:hypothetical protein